MESIISKFSNLSILSQKKVAPKPFNVKRFIISFTDTEGAPTRDNGTSNMWNIYHQMEWLVDFNLNNGVIIKKEPIFHTCHMIQPRKIHHKQASKPIYAHRKQLEVILEKHKADKIIVCCWGANHDRACFNHYGDWNEMLVFVDLLQPFRNKYPGLPASLDKQPNPYKYKRHTAIGDTLLMKDVVEDIFNKNVVEGIMNHFFESTYMKKEKQKKNEEKIKRTRPKGPQEIPDGNQKHEQPPKYSKPAIFIRR